MWGPSSLMTPCRMSQLSLLIAYTPMFRLLRQWPGLPCFIDHPWWHMAMSPMEQHMFQETCVIGTSHHRTYFTWHMVRNTYMPCMPGTWYHMLRQQSYSYKMGTIVLESNHHLKNKNEDHHMTTFVETVLSMEVGCTRRVQMGVHYICWREKGMCLWSVEAPGSFH